MMKELLFVSFISLLLCSHGFAASIEEKPLFPLECKKELSTVVKNHRASQFLVAKFSTITGDQKEDPVWTSSPVMSPIDPSLTLTLKSDDFPEETRGKCMVLEVSLSLTNTYYEGIPQSGTEFAIKINDNERLRGQSSIAVNKQRIPFHLQGWIHNVRIPQNTDLPLK